MSGEVTFGECDRAPHPWSKGWYWSRPPLDPCSSRGSHLRSFGRSRLLLLQRELLSQLLSLPAYRSVRSLQLCELAVDLDAGLLLCVPVRQ